MLVRLDLAPERARRAGGLRQIAEVNRMAGIGDIDERRPVDAADERDRTPRLRIVVAPDIAELDAALAADRRHREERHQIDLIAIEHLDFAVRALAVGARDRGERGYVTHEMRCLSPHARWTPRVEHHATLTVILIRDGNGNERTARGNLCTELGAAPLHGRRRPQPRSGREASRVARDTEDTSLESIRAVGADPKLVADLGEGDAVARAEAPVKRQRPRDGIPAAGRGVAREDPDGS